MRGDSAAEKQAAARDYARLKPIRRAAPDVTLVRNEFARLGNEGQQIGGPVVHGEPHRCLKIARKKADFLLGGGRVAGMQTLFSSK
jgi:hypothetical protein